jgi:prepilin-type processing-associated H-X9-DG protein
MKINLYGLEISKLEKLMLEEGQKKYRATQLYIWMYEKKATTFDEMSDISLRFREVLNEKYCLEIPTIHTRQDSQDGTVKLLLELKDSAKVECVLMRYKYGNALCVSSQVGCNMGCSFCSSGLLGKQRNLETHEMIGQLLVMNNLLKEENRVAFAKYQNIIKVYKEDTFENNGLFVSECSYHNNTVNVSFADSYDAKRYVERMMERYHLDDLKPVKVTVWLKWYNSRSVCNQGSIETAVDFRNPRNLTITGLPDVPLAKEIGIEVYFDDNLMCYVTQPLESSELWK